MKCTNLIPVFRSTDRLYNLIIGINLVLFLSVITDIELWQFAKAFDLPLGGSGLQSLILTTEPPMF
jgi:hypothetical protein